MTPSSRGFTDTITSLESAWQLTPDDTGEHKKQSEKVYVELSRYREDMKDVLDALKLLKTFHDRTSWALKILASIFAGACVLVTAVAALIGAFKHG